MFRRESGQRSIDTLFSSVKNPSHEMASKVQNLIMSSGGQELIVKPVRAPTGRTLPLRVRTEDSIAGAIPGGWLRLILTGFKHSIN